MSVKSAVGTAADWLTRSYLIWLAILVIVLGIVLWVYHRGTVDNAIDAAKYELGLEPSMFSASDDWNASWDATPVPAPSADAEPSPPPASASPPTGATAEAAAKGWIRETCTPWPQCEWKNTGD